MKFTYDKYKQLDWVTYVTFGIYIYIYIYIYMCVCVCMCVCICVFIYIYMVCITYFIVSEYKYEYWIVNSEYKWWIQMLNTNAEYKCWIWKLIMNTIYNINNEY